jgi:hypothetical protein
MDKVHVQVTALAEILPSVILSLTVQAGKEVCQEKAIRRTVALMFVEKLCD